MRGSASDDGRGTRADAPTHPGLGPLRAPRFQIPWQVVRALAEPTHAGNTKKTPLDECGRVYKDLDAVLGVLEAEGIAKVAHRLHPIANMKGMD